MDQMERAPRGIRIRSDNEEPLDGIYEIDAWCANCDWEGAIGIPKGMPAKHGEHVGRHIRCEVCGCCTLRRCEREEEPAEGSDEATIVERLRELMEERERKRSPAPSRVGLWVNRPTWEYTKYTDNATLLAANPATISHSTTEQIN